MSEREVSDLAVPSCVIHVPHASRAIPQEVRDAYVLGDDELEAELLRMTDHFTDDLFDLGDALARVVRHPVSRLVVDPERFTDDAQEVMSAKGMGVIYTRACDGRTLRESPTPEERDRLLATHYKPHHQRLTDAVDELLARHGECLLIDGHSFPREALPYEDPSASRPEMCLGSDSYHTPTWLRDVADDAFKRQGFGVAWNAPFAGAIVPLRWYRTDSRVCAVMVEVNRGLYMDELTGEPAKEYGRLKARLQAALSTLVDAAASRVA